MSGRQWRCVSVWRTRSDSGCFGAVVWFCMVIEGGLATRLQLWQDFADLRSVVEPVGGNATRELDAQPPLYCRLRQAS